MRTGFTNEKSAEYIVINDLYNKVKKECSFFYPFIFQSKRDDTFLSMKNEVDNLGLIICFARRPKIRNLGDDMVEVTFRETLFECSNFFYCKDVYSVIGVPIGSRIEELGFGAVCKWFYPQKVHEQFSYCWIEKEDLSVSEYSSAAKPPVRCGGSHLSGLTEPLVLHCHAWV